MAKVIIFSREFPKYHPKAGQPTHFVEQFYNSIFSEDGDWSNAPGDASSYVIDLNTNIKTKKNHTIRSGNRFKKGDFFSPRVWSGKPYRSKQIIIAPDTIVKKVYEIEITQNGIIFIDNEVNWLLNVETSEIAKNDGLTRIDFEKWFAPDKKKFKGFKGQIICWSDKINY